jgi:hypothetical protein
MKYKTLVAQAAQANCILALSQISSPRSGHSHRHALCKQNGPLCRHPWDHGLDFASLVLDPPLDLQSAFVCLLLFAGLKLGTQQHKQLACVYILLGLFEVLVAPWSKAVLGVIRFWLDLSQVKPQRTSGT